MMKKNLDSVLVEYLKKQRYPYLWELKLLSMIIKKGKDEFINFCTKAIGEPKGAICLPYDHPLKTTNVEIISFIKSIQENEKQACIVIAHAHYNPVDLQAIYILDCEKGEEEECFAAVLKRWEACSELYFFAMNIDFIIGEIIRSVPRSGKFVRFFLSIAHYFKGHDEHLIFSSNIYGDMIHSSNGKRSIWECHSCGSIVLKDELHK